MTNECRYCGSVMQRTIGSCFEVSCCNSLKEDWRMSINIEALEKQLASAKKERSKFREINEMANKPKKKNERRK